MHLAKSVSQQRVLDDVSFYICRGEIVSIIGLQNSGKHLLTDILSGTARADAGSIFLNGQPFDCSSIVQAQRAGIFYMSQKLQLVQDMSVAMNLYLLNTKTEGTLLSPRRIQAGAAAILERYHLDIKPSTPVSALSPIEARLLDLVRIAIQQPKLVILSDIPLTDDNVRDPRFLRIVQELQRNGVSLLFVGNKISKAALMSDRVYLLQAGILSVGLPRDQLDADQIFQLLTGGRRHLSFQPESSGTKKELLSIWTGPRSGGGVPLLRLHKGEILGLVHEYMPNAAPELALSFFLEAWSRLYLYRDGRPTRWRKLRHILQQGAAIIPDLEKEGGSFPNLNFIDDLSLISQKELAWPGGLLSRRRMLYTAQHSAAFLGIEDRELDAPIPRGLLSTELSKKIQIGRWLWKQPEIYIFFNPFSALDEQGYEAVKLVMKKLARCGAGLLILSSDYNKLYDICGQVTEFSM